jgi:hypothetical protein
MTYAPDSGMQSLGKVFIFIALACRLRGADAWPQILSSIGVPPGDERVSVAEMGAVADAAWRNRVEAGAYLILQGNSALAASFGFRPNGPLFEMKSMVDVHAARLPLILEKPLSVRPFTLPAGARVFTKDRWSDAPAIAGLKIGKGAVLWVITNPGPHGYERFPYLPQALADLGWEPLVRADRTWAFFDYSYRTRVDLDYFASRWRKAGISALHVASWHFYEHDAERDEYLNHLIEACHREGILVYAWLELPHVSNRFWDEHPQWREKTATLQDAALDWRRLMNLTNPECARAVKKGISDLINRFDWDGVNLAELYYESLEGAANPGRFTPMNDEVRSRFRAENGFDPVDLWISRKDAQSLRQFLNFRTSLARQMQVEWLAEMEKARFAHPDLDIVLTHVDDRIDKGMTDAIGADSERAFSLLKNHSFTFLVEDPATLWDRGPSRYPEIARSYPASEKLAIDINVVDRYQDVYPTKQQTGIELFQLLHLASESFPRVALYFENSILTADLPFLAAASAVVTRFERSAGVLRVDSPRGFSTPWSGSATVDGAPWAALTGLQITLPAGTHTVRPALLSEGPRVLSFNGSLVFATAAGKELRIGYSSSSRALAVLNCDAGELTVDGKRMDFHRVGRTVILPGGKREASIVCK